VTRQQCALQAKRIPSRKNKSSSQQLVSAQLASVSMPHVGEAEGDVVGAEFGATDGDGVWGEEVGKKVGDVVGKLTVGEAVGVVVGEHVDIQQVWGHALRVIVCKRALG